MLLAILLVTMCALAKMAFDVSRRYSAIISSDGSTILLYKGCTSCSSFNQNSRGLTSACRGPPGNKSILRHQSATCLGPTKLTRRNSRIPGPCHGNVSFAKLARATGPELGKPMICPVRAFLCTVFHRFSLITIPHTIFFASSVRSKIERNGAPTILP